MSKRENDKWRDTLAVISAHKYQCKLCGRKEIIGAQRDRVICSHCGHYIYKSEELEFKYKMLEAIKK